MKVTVCELSDNEQQFVEDWNGLRQHISLHKPDLLLLPEMPFSKWIASEKKVNPASRILSVDKHEKWMGELERLDAKLVVYSKPVITEQGFFNTAFVYDKNSGHQKIHSKTYFPEEPHFWEETWYSRDAVTDFEPITIGGIKLGVLLCTEMWFTEFARQYGKQGIDLLLCPRATGINSVNQWLRCGQTLSIISGAYCLSSNKSGKGDHDFIWGGNGWIAEPISGNVMGTTIPAEKFISRDIDLERSRLAKKAYPLYVKS